VWTSASSEPHLIYPHVPTIAGFPDRGNSRTRVVRSIPGVSL